jgi:uncharacterized protein YecE (DUF72 family)
MSAPLYIGPAGWSYPDWNGTVYPTRKPRGFDPLEFITSYFNLVEINSTFYRLPAVESSKRWAQRVAGAADFRFTAKAHQEFTHAATALDRRSVEAFKRSISPLLEAERLLCVLLQFPWSFKKTDSNRRRLLKLIEAFRPVPVAVEVRHGSWGRDGALDELLRAGASVCAVDQPSIGDSLDLLSHGTAPSLGGPGQMRYFRFHGRNKSEWFRRGTNRDLRYNYLYSRGELTRLADSVRRAGETARQVVVVLNNHFRGQAVANALELKSILAGGKVAVPAGVSNTYPRLGPIALPDPNAAATEGWLFDPDSPAEEDQ